jgi:hypothetical protein
MAMRMLTWPDPPRPLGVIRSARKVECRPFDSLGVSGTDA